jgi:hypothetical protein
VRILRTIQEGGVTQPPEHARCLDQEQNTNAGSAAETVGKSTR